jgi:hypothetical protein
VLEHHLEDGAVFVGLAADHHGKAAVLSALFGGGARRSAKPSRELARVDTEAVVVQELAKDSAPASAAERRGGDGTGSTAAAAAEEVQGDTALPVRPTTCDLLIQSRGGLWPEHMYLDRVTVHRGKARHTSPSVVTVRVTLATRNSLPLPSR